LIKKRTKFLHYYRKAFLGNSEGAQFLDRYLPFSKFLNNITYHTPDNKPAIEILGTPSNPGTQLFWDSWRPIFKNREIIAWEEYDQDSIINLWPLGLYDPPPYILESLDEWPHGDPDEYPDDPDDLIKFEEEAGKQLTEESESLSKEFVDFYQG